MLDASDDPIARDQHAPDDDQTEHDELEGGGQPHRSQHLVQTREEEGGRERGQRAGQASGQGRAPITTAAIGPRRYVEPTATPGVRSSPASATPATA